MRMQVCDLLVQLGGDTNSITTPKFNVTVAEAVVLNQLHGKGLTKNISRMHNFRLAERSPIAEKARLVRIYHLGPQDPDKPGIVDRVFPGLSPQFPETFVQAGFGEELHGLPFPKHDPHADRKTSLADEEFEYVDEAAGMSLQDALSLPEPVRAPEEDIDVRIEEPDAPAMTDADLGLVSGAPAAPAPNLNKPPLSLKRGEEALAKIVGAKG